MVLSWLIGNGVIMEHKGCELKCGVGVKLLGVSALAMCLSACSLVRDKSLDYQKTELVKPISVPAEVAEPRRADAYPVPSVSARSQDSFAPDDDDDVPRYSSSVKSSGLESVTIVESDDGASHLIVEKTHREVFPVVVQFAKVNGLSVKRLDQKSGLIELEPVKRTDEKKSSWWSKPKPEREEWTFKVQQQNSNVTVMIESRVSEKRETDEQVEWVLVRENDSDDLAALDSVMEDLGHYIDRNEPDWLSPMVTRRYQSIPKVMRTVDGTGYPIIMLVSDFNQAWSKVETVLRQSRSLELEDKNLSEGFFLIKSPDHDEFLQLRIDRVETGVVITLQQDDNTLAPLAVSSDVIDTLERSLKG